MNIGELYKRAKEAIGFVGEEEASPAMALVRGHRPPTIEKLSDLLGQHAFADILPYRYYDEETGIFHNTNSHGFVIEVTPLTGANEQTIKMLSGLFANTLPKNTGIQFHLWASPNIYPQLRAWANSRIEDPDGNQDEITGKRKRRKNIYAQMARRRFEFLIDKAYNSICDDQNMYVRDYRLFVSVVFPDANPDEKQISRVHTYRKGVKSVLTSTGMFSVDVDATGFLNWLDEVFNADGGIKRDLIEWNDTRPLNEQIISGETCMLVGNEGMTIGNNEVKTFSVRAYPKAWPLWGMSELIGNTFMDALRIPGHFLFTMGVYIPDQEALQKTVIAKSVRATQNAEGYMAKFIPSMHEVKKDWDFVTRKIDEGESIVYAYHQFVSFTRHGEGSDAEQKIKSVFKSNSWVLQTDKFVQVQGLLGALPMMLEPVFYEELKRFKRINTMLTYTAANSLPVIAEDKGNGHKAPMLLTIGRKGQIQSFNNFHNEMGNYNMSIIAGSGSGKSFFAQEVIGGVLGQGGRVFVFDNGRSYFNECKIKGGTFIEFTDEADIKLNPFSTIPDREDAVADAIDVMHPILCQMAGPIDGISDWQSSILQKVIQDAWMQKRTEATITTVAEKLNEINDKRAHDLAIQLHPYTKDGIYGRYFEGECNLDLSNDFIVLELQELANKKALQNVVLLLLMYHVTFNMYMDRSRVKLALLDEAWSLLKGGEHSADFIERGYRVVRKYRGCFATITQKTSDYFTSQAAEACLTNSDWTLYLRQKPEAIEQDIKNGHMVLDEYGVKLLKSLVKKDGKYSEILFKGPDGYYVGRFATDPFTGQLYSTKPEEFTRIQKEVEKGRRIDEVIDEIIAEKRMSAG